KAATDTSFKSLSSSLDAKTKIAISVPTGSEIGKGSASADITTAVVGDTVTYRVNFEVGYTPTFMLTGNNGNLSAPTKGTSQWLYTYVIAENDTTVSAAVTFAARAAVSLVPPTAPAPIFADNAANKSESALSAWLGTQAKPTATYDNDTTQKVTATYTLKNESTFNAKGGSYSFTANAEGRTCDLSLTVKPVTAAVTAPANISLEERKSGYTQEQLGLPNSTTLTYSGDGYTEKSDTTSITWQDAGLGADFGKSPSKGNVFSGTALLPSWATGNNKVSLDVDITPAYLTDLAITHAPGKTTYRQDELFDKTGMVVEATYSDKTKKTVTGYTFTPSGALKGTDTKVVVRYTSDGITKTADQAITVLVPFIVNFDADGGQGQFPNQSLCLGDKVTNPADPTKSGYTFKGWFVGNSAFDFTSTVTGPITLKAKWVDKTAPTSVAAFYEKDGNWVSFGTGSTLNLLFDHSVSVKLTAEDAGTGVKSFTYTLGDKVQTLDAAGDEAIISIATPYIGNLSVTAADAAGNQSTPIATEYFAVDGENPAALTVETNGYTPGDWTNKDITLTLSGATAVSGIAGYDFSTDDGKTWTAMTVTDKSEATATTPATVNKGEVTITTDTDTSYLFRAVSNVHLISDSSAPLSVKRDNQVPDNVQTGDNSPIPFLLWKVALSAGILLLLMGKIRKSISQK
ncbi:MAG: InlB B-repeat-containing protein, partial [Oscillospiraceae bacterium]